MSVSLYRGRILPVPVEDGALRVREIAENPIETGLYDMAASVNVGLYVPVLAVFSVEVGCGVLLVVVVSVDVVFCVSLDVGFCVLVLTVFSVDVDCGVSVLAVISVDIAFHVSVLVFPVDVCGVSVVVVSSVGVVFF